jgi:hypothetical protein
MAIEAPDCPGLLFGLSRALLPTIAFIRIARGAGVEERQANREQVIELLMFALPRGLRLLAEWATRLERRALAAQG